MDPAALKELEIAGLTADSRDVEPGYLFAALPGAKVDGRAFLVDAVARGASAILAPPGTDLGDARADANGKVVRLITDSNPRRRFALMAAKFYRNQPNTVAAAFFTWQSMMKMFRCSFHAATVADPGETLGLYGNVGRVGWIKENKWQLDHTRPCWRASCIGRS